MNFRVFIVFLFILIATPCLGAKIYLKDGGVEESDKVWEQDGYIHFILKGTQQVVIRYSKDIIDKIEGTTFSRKESAPPLEDQSKQTKLSQESIRGMINRYEARYNQLMGIGFYDPRRPAKYWVDITSHHDTLKQAVADLAAQYGRTPAWVIANMGRINDLGVIHKNLIESIQKSETKPLIKVAEISSGRKSTLADQPEKNFPSQKQPQKSNALPPADPDAMQNIPFYNPRSPLKYWSDANTGHHTIAEAIAALARKYGRSPVWVEENMGHVNDLGRIHRNLRQRLTQ